MGQLLGHVLAVLFLASSVNAAPESPKVVLYFDGEVELSASERVSLADIAMRLLKSANFDTVNHPDILKQSVSQIQRAYRTVAAKNHLVVSLPEPVTVETVGGTINVQDIVIGLNHPQYANAVFTINSESRVVAHEKYYGGVAIELRQTVHALVSPK